MKNFRPQFTTSYVLANTLLKAGAKKYQPCSDNAIKFFVHSSNNLLRKCKEKCHESVSARRKRPEKYFLSSRVQTHFSPRDKTASIFIEKRRIDKMYETYWKLFKLNPSLHCDTEWCRTAECSNVWWENVRECDERHQTYEDIDILF